MAELNNDEVRGRLAVEVVCEKHRIEVAALQALFTESMNRRTRTREDAVRFADSVRVLVAMLARESFVYSANWQMAVDDNLTASEYEARILDLLKDGAANF